MVASLHTAAGGGYATLAVPSGDRVDAEDSSGHSVSAIEQPTRMHTDCLAGVYYEKGQYDQEVANYEKAAELAPGDCSAQYWLGTAYEDQGRYDKAVERYRAAIAIKPDKTALHDLIIIDLVNGDRREASELIPELKELDAGLGRKLELLLRRSR